MRIVFIFFVALLASGCGTTPDVKARVIYWESSLSSEAPVGSSKEQLIHWGENHGVSFTYLDQQHVLYAIAEKIPDPSGIVCTQWNITLQVSLNVNNVSTQQKVGSVGSCL